MRGEHPSKYTAAFEQQLVLTVFAGSVCIPMPLNVSMP